MSIQKDITDNLVFFLIINQNLLYLALEINKGKNEKFTKKMVLYHSIMAALLVRGTN
jgi:hypothetical protein